MNIIIAGGGKVGSELTGKLSAEGHEITLIDNRYINSNEFFKLIEFKNQDIIFIYSTLIINDSGSLKG